MQSTPTSSATNRLTTAGTQYDAEGNLVLWNSGPSYEYDAFNRMRRFRGGVAPGSEEWVFAYTADDERVFSARVGGGGTVWSLRGLDNQLLREWRAEDGKHSFRDYVWTGRNLLAKIERTPAAGSPGWSEETRHAAVDHLGSVRLWTDAAGANLPGFIYYPFGKQLNGTVDDEQMRFTGHERDLWNTTSSNDDLDYMHARHYNPQLGRFLQIDPLAGSVSAPQSLNRYAYVASNPINYTDPSGMLRMAWDCGYKEDPPHTTVIAGGVQVNTTWVVFGCTGGGQGPQLTDRGYGWGGTPGRKGTPTGSPNPTPPTGGPEDPPEDPPKDPPGEECAELSPAQARYLDSWNSYDSTLASMLSDVGANKQGINLHMAGTAGMYLLGVSGAGALGYGLQVNPATNPILMAQAGASGFAVTRLGQALFQPGTFLNTRRYIRYGISMSGGKFVWRAAGPLVKRWASKNGHAFERGICPK